jgi:hypothetical protein
MALGKFTDEDKKKLYKFLKSKGYLSKKEVEKYDAEYGLKEKSAAFKQGFVDKIAEISTSEWLGNLYGRVGSMRDTALQLLGKNGRPDRGDPAFEGWKTSPIGRVVDEADSNNSGFADYTPAMDYEFGGRGKAPSDITGFLNAFEAYDTRPEMYAKMTGANTQAPKVSPLEVFDTHN